MIHTAIILAGGFGTRLKNVISDVPKPMAPINGEPFLTYQLNYLNHYGIKKVILSVGYLADVIKDYYKDFYKNIEITYVIESTPLGTGGGIRLAMKSCDDNTILILNGDSFFEINLIDFYNLHLQKKSEVSLALRHVENASRYGTIKTNAENRIISFKEKNQISKSGTINAGVYLVNKNLFLLHTLGDKNFSIEKDFFELQLNQLSLYGFIFSNYFIDIGIPDDYNKAQHDFKRFEH